MFNRIKSNIAIFPCGILVLFILIAIFAPFIQSIKPLEMNSESLFMPPNREFLLGTDNFGRDQLSRLIFGARISLGVSFISVISTILIATIIGSISGYIGGITDEIIMKIMDALLAFPTIVLALGFLTFTGGGVFNLIVAINISLMPWFVKVIRAKILSLKNNEYITTSVALVGSNQWILMRHLIPNTFTTILVLISISLPIAMIIESSLSFMGIRIKSPYISWGIMLRNSLLYMEHAPWLVIAPGIAFLIVTMTLGFISNFLRDTLDPKMKFITKFRI